MELKTRIIPATTGLTNRVFLEVFVLLSQDEREEFARPSPNGRSVLNFLLLPKRVAGVELYVRDVIDAPKRIPARNRNWAEAFDSTIRRNGLVLAAERVPAHVGYASQAAA